MNNITESNTTLKDSAESKKNDLGESSLPSGSDILLCASNIAEEAFSFMGLKSPLIMDTPMGFFLGATMAVCSEKKDKVTPLSRLSLIAGIALPFIQNKILSTPSLSSVALAINAYATYVFAHRAYTKIRDCFDSSKTPYKDRGFNLTANLLVQGINTACAANRTRNIFNYYMEYLKFQESLRPISLDDLKSSQEAINKVLKAEESINPEDLTCTLCPDACKETLEKSEFSKVLRKCGRQWQLKVHPDKYRHNDDAEKASRIISDALSKKQMPSIESLISNIAMEGNKTRTIDHTPTDPCNVFKKTCENINSKKLKYPYQIETILNEENKSLTNRIKQYISNLNRTIDVTSCPRPSRWEEDFASEKKKYLGKISPECGKYMEAANALDDIPLFDYYLRALLGLVKKNRST